MDGVCWNVFSVAGSVDAFLGSFVPSDRQTNFPRLDDEAGFAHHRIWLCRDIPGDDGRVSHFG